MTVFGSEMEASAAKKWLMAICRDEREKEKESSNVEEEEDPRVLT